MCAAHRLVLSVVGLLLGAASAAQGQGYLRKVEDKLGAIPPAASAATPEKGYLGGEFDDPRPGQKGVLVMAVRTNGPAELGGLKANDLITAIDGKAVAGLDDLDAVLEKAMVNQKLRMAVSRAGRSLEIVVTLGKKPATSASAEQNPGEAPPPLPPGTVPPSTATPPASSAPPSGPAFSPGAASPRSPAPSEPPLSFGGPRPPVDRPGSGGAFSPRPLSPPADSSVLPAPAPGESGTGTDPIRSRPLDLGPPPAASTPAESAPSSAAGTAPEAALPEGGSATSGGPSLGITVDELTEEARTAYGLTPRHGALITAVRAGSPADRAGLPVGGAVVRLGNRPIASADDLVTAIRTARPGQEIELGYYEGADYTRKTIKLAPSTSAAAPGSLPRVPGAMPAGDRPLIGRVERMVENFGRGGSGGSGGALSTVYDPSVVAALQAQVTELTATVKKLEERVRTLEGNRGAGTSAAPAVTPGFGSAPIGPATPGFVPGLAPPGTNP